MAEHWQSLVANLSTVALFISAWVHGQFIFAGQARRWRNVAFGVTMGMGSAASMMLSIPFGGMFFDLRLSLIALAGYFGGPLAALVAVVIAVAYRSFLGGPAELPAIASIIVVAVLGVAISRLTRERLSSLLSIGILAGAVALVCLLWTAMFQLGSSGSLSPLVWVVALMNAVATRLCAFFIMRSSGVERERDLFRAAFAESPDFEYVKTPDSRFAAVNMAVARFYGFSSPAEMIGKTDFDLVAPDRAEILLRAEQAIVKTGEPLIDYEEKIVDQAGDEVWFATTKVPLHDADGEIIGIAGATRDITAAKRLKTEVTESRNQLNYVLSEISDGIAMFDPQGTLVYRNEQYCSLFPLTAGVRRSGQHIRDILEAVAAQSEQKGIPPGRETAWIDEIAATLHATGEQEIELFDGRWLHLRTRPTSDGSALVVVSDVTKTKEAEAALLSMTEQLKLLATTDGLTGLTNRRAFDQALEGEMARHRRSRLSMALLMIDVDRFKKYNDLYGHQAGDDALKAIAECLRAELKRPGDIAARYGGEEFIAILPATDEDGACFIADAIRESLSALHLQHRGSEKGIVTVSIGVAVYTDAEATMDSGELVRRADRALYTAKDSGRDRVTRWSPLLDMSPSRQALA
jgi:diguanylate cyclase (GGDEF)-like protein/PAS domain S-box-containing protein